MTICEKQYTTSMYPEGCLRWDIQQQLLGLTNGVPQLYFPYQNVYSESTTGSNVFVPTGQVDFDTGAVGRAVRLGRILGAAQISLPTNSIVDLSAPSFTMRFWMNLLQFLSGSQFLAYAHVLKKNAAPTPPYNGGSLTDGWAVTVFMIRGSQTGQVWFRMGNGLNLQFIHPGGGAAFWNAWNFGFWFHYVVTWSASDKTLRTYVNASGNSLASPSFTPVLNSEPLVATNAITIENGTGPPLYLLIDELGFWDYAWDQSQISCDYSNRYTWP